MNERGSSLLTPKEGRFAMTAKRKQGSMILAAVHETAHDLHAAGLIDTRRMEHYGALCLAPAPKCGSATTRALCARHKFSR